MIDYSRLAFIVASMTSQDIAAIMLIEEEAFSAPWSERAYDYELRYNEMAHYYVVRPATGGARPPAVASPWWQRFFARTKSPSGVAQVAPIVAYGGFWLMLDEAHISTIATDHMWRRRGIGELLLIAMIDGAAEVGAHTVTLEVRVSNHAAQALYRKYAFAVVGERPHYYSDNGEDAYIMTTPVITTAEYQRDLQALKTKLFARLMR